MKAPIASGEAPQEEGSSREDPWRLPLEELRTSRASADITACSGQEAADMALEPLCSALVVCFKRRPQGRTGEVRYEAPGGTNDDEMGNGVMGEWM